MDLSKLDVRSGNPFPWHFILLAALILVAGICLIPERPAIGATLAFAAGFILTTHAGTEIDKNKGLYREYTLFYFLVRSGKQKKFTGAEKIFINRSRMSTTVYTAHTSESKDFKTHEYNVYLKLLDGTKVHLLNSRKKEKLATPTQAVASFLNIPVQDNTIV